MSKKLIAILLLVVMVLGCALTACQKDPQTPGKDSEQNNPVDQAREIKAGTKVIMGNTT